MTSPITSSQSTVPEIVIVGAGPVGVRAAQEVLWSNANVKVVLFSKEEGKPYNRALLTSLLFRGEKDVDQLSHALGFGSYSGTLQRYGSPVVAIDRDAATVTDATGRIQHYSVLILALGAIPSTPALPGISLPGVFNFHVKQDLEAVIAFHATPRRTVVLGGGVLGIETSIALKQQGADVTLIGQASTLMPRQLDRQASDILANKVKSLGIDTMLQSQVVEVLGEESVQGLRLADGKIILCDCLILAVGARANIALANQAGLSTDRGIIVDDTMRSSDRNIFAVGDCAQHRGTVYGLLSPGFEQAKVAAQCALGRQVTYYGSTSVTQVKMGINPLVITGEQRPYVIKGERVYDVASSRDYKHVARCTDTDYRKLTLYKGRLTGATWIGNWKEWDNIQEAITQQRRVYPWELMRFRRTGLLWHDQGKRQVSAWPEATIVCNCVGVTRGEISRAIEMGHTSIKALSTYTGAAASCGSCLPLLAELLGYKDETKLQQKNTGIFISSLLVLAVIGLFLSLNPFPVAMDLTHNVWSWDAQSRDIAWNQITGFTILGLIMGNFALSLRKRWVRGKLVSVDGWRTVHGFLGVFSLGAVVIHTGLHAGSNLNQLLLITFMATSLLGAISGGLTTLARKRVSAAVNNNLARWTRIHTFVLWPLAVLVGFHILSSYYF